MQDTLMSVQHLKKYFAGRRRGTFVKAVDDVSFDIAKGETLGIVGESGCGKSTLGRTMIRLIEPTEGHVFYEGKDLSALSAEEMRLKRREIQIIFQDPYASLNPRMTVKELIRAPLDVFSNESESAKMDRVMRIMNLVGLREEFMYKYPHEFSGGQRQRIVIARALILEPRFIFCDEPVSALDASVRAQVLNLMKRIQREMDLTYLFISHDLSVVRFLCDRVGVMYLGHLVELADKHTLYEHPVHPYTKALLSSIPVPDTEVKTEKIILRGEVPSPYNPPTGCPFHTRCPEAQDICRQSMPEMRDLGDGHTVSCHFCNEKGE